MEDDSATDGSRTDGSAAAAVKEQPSTEGAQTHERQTLALDALAKLTRQFSRKPDFDHLVNVILMTLCGQFTVANSFAVLKKPRVQGSESAFFATGRFKTNTALRTLCVGMDRWNWRRTDGGVYRIRDLHHLIGSVQTVSVLGEADVAVMCQLVHGDKPLGIIGLGRKVSGKPYTATELGLIHSVANTITPLLANTYMFWEMVSLNAQYLEIINSVRQGIFVFDQDCTLRRVNSAGLEIIKSGTGTDIGPLIDAPMEQVFPDLAFAGWAGQFREMMASRRVAPRALVAKTRSGDRLYNIGITSSPEAPATGWTIIVTLDDVTTQKEAEHRLFDLQQATDARGSETGAEVGDVLARVAAGLESISSALSNGDIPEASSVVASLKSVLAGQGYFTAGPADDVNLDDGMQKGNLNSTITDVLSFLTMQKRYRQIAISPDLDFGIPDMVINPDQIVMLLLNLISNAVDAIGESGRFGGYISVRTCRDARDAVIMVADNGAGVTPEVKDRLFREQVTTKARGRGCGLVTCRKIIDNHGGSVSVESGQGEGTSVTVRLPIVEAASPSSKRG